MTEIEIHVSIYIVNDRNLMKHILHLLAPLGGVQFAPPPKAGVSAKCVSISVYMYQFSDGA